MINRRKQVYRENRAVMAFVISLGVFIFVITCWNLGKLNQICVLNDEFGYWGTAAYFAGYDWTGLSGTSPYYGFGIAPFYALLFKVFKDVTIIYKGAIVLNAFMLVAAFFLSLSCCKKMFPRMADFYRILFCTFLTLYPNNLVQSQIAWTETILYLWFWVCCYMIISIYEKPRRYKAVLYGAWLLYGMMIHQRVLGVICAGVVIILFLKIINRIDWKFFMLFLGTVVISFVLFYVIKGYLNDNFWVSISDTIASKNNMSGQVKKIEKIFSIEGLVDFFYEVCGQAFYLIVSTCFLVFGFLFEGGKRIVQILKSLMKKKKIVCGKYGVVVIFVFIAFVATFLISTISTAGLTNRGDTLLYGRYNEFLIGPVLLIGLHAFYTAKQKWQTFAVVTGIGVCIAYVVNHVFANHYFSAFYCTNCVGVATSFSESAYYNAGTYSAFVKVMLAVFLVLLLISSRFADKIMYVLGGVCILTMLWIPAAEYNNENTYQLQQNFSENVVDVVEFIEGEKAEETIYYVADDWGADAFQREISDRGIKYIQFYLYDKKIDIQGFHGLETGKELCIVRKESWCYWNMFEKYDLVYDNDQYGVFRSSM